MVVDPKLRVHGAVAQAQGHSRLLCTVCDSGLQVRTETRGRNVNAFLEIGAVQRVRLVKERQCLQTPSGNQAFQGNLDRRE